MPQLVGTIVNLLEQIADYWMRVVRMYRCIPLEGAQQLLLDRGVMRMTEGAQARLIQRFGISLESA